MFSTRFSLRHALLTMVACSAVAPTDVAIAQGTNRPTCATSGDASVAALHRDWILVGWEKKAGDGPLNFREKLGKYYDWSSDDVMLYDDFDPEHRVTRSPAAYGAIWEPSFSSLRTAHHRLSIRPSVVASDGLAASTLQFVARLEAGDGAVTGIRTLSTLVWRCTGEGWKIVREHNSSVVLPPAQVDAALSSAFAN